MNLCVFFVDFTFLIKIVSKVCNLCRLVLYFFYLDYCKLCLFQCTNVYIKKKKKKNAENTLSGEFPELLKKPPQYNLSTGFFEQNPESYFKQR